MKKWTILLLSGLLLLQTACSDTPRVAPETLTERTEVQTAVDLDPLKSYPAERPEIAPPKTETPVEEPSEEVAPAPENPMQEEQPPVPVSPAEQPKPAEPTPAPAESSPPAPEAPSVSKEEETPVKSETVSKPVQSRPEEVRAVWFSFFELETMLMGQSESAYTKKLGTAFDNVAALGLNTVILQVRPYADAIYPSEHFPWSYLATGTEGGDPGFDPLKIAIREAHNRGLALEAWINPYRIRNSNYNKPLSGQIKSLLSSGDAIDYKGAITFDPASKKAQQLIVDGVTEIVKNYDVDGIHFDDYFYPSTDDAFDQASYKAYQKSGGKLALAQWRRENVNQLVKQVYTAVHSTKSAVRFGISPQGNLENNYNKQFIDVAKWLSTEGYVDYICPQIYFGFQNGTSPYAETVAQWNDLIKTSSVELIIGLAPYKVGLEDTWAGEGKNEWKQNSDLLSRMVSRAREEKHYDGFVLFRYDSVFNPAKAVKGQINKEIDSLKELLQ